MTPSSSISSRRRRRTLRDVARLAEVDVSTVSRSLNGDPRINADRARQIRELAESMGYRPRPFRGKYSRSIGLLYSTTRRQRMPDNDFLQRMVWIGQERLAASGFFAHLEAVSIDDPEALPSLVRENRIDGVLLLGYFPAAFAAALTEIDMPAVALNDSGGRIGISCVRSDPQPAVAGAVTQLAARGHRRFALMVGNPDHPTVAARLAAYRRTLGELGLPDDAGLILQGLEATPEGGRTGVERLYAEAGAAAGAITAVLCENDWIALGALMEYQRRGVAVPGDVSLVGHDDLWICRELRPELSSIHRDEAGLMSHAVELLSRIIRRDVKTPLDVVVEETLVLRGSVAAAPDRKL